jgi:hypothetical protein
MIYRIDRRPIGVKRLFLTLSITLLVTGGTLCASTVSVPLPGLHGLVESQSDYNSPLRSTEFDFGARFAAIDSVFVDIAVADEVPGLLNTGNTFPLPLSVRTGPEEPISFDSAHRFDEDGFTHRVFFDNFRPDLLDFYAPFRDGKGSLALFANPGFFTCASEGCPPIPTVVRPATGRIVDARILVEGSIVPEPSTIWLAMFGVIGITRRWAAGSVR